MGKLPAFQFYPADWLNDIKLQSCSIAAQGLLINLMCLMHQSEKYGFLLINGEKSSKKASKIVRLTPKKFSNLVEELVENGVLKKDENGAVYCERMVKDQALREIRKMCGKLGGNPNLLNQEDKQPDNQKPTPSSSSSSSTTYRAFAHLKISVKEFDKLNVNYTKEQIDGILDAIENHKNNKNYKSLYLTANNWIKKEPKRTKKEYVDIAS